VLVLGHASWFHERERRADHVTLALWLGSLLVAVPILLTAGCAAAVAIGGLAATSGSLIPGLEARAD
jgi:hypothetical protein